MQDWSYDPKVSSARYSATTETRYYFLDDAYRAALEVLSTTLQTEIEEEDDEPDLYELHDNFPVDKEAHMVQQDRAEDADGIFRIRALYVNDTENVKVTSGVNRRPGQKDL